MSVAARAARAAISTSGMKNSQSRIRRLELALVVVLFKEGTHLNLNNFYKHIISILLIAIIGTIFTTVLVGLSLLFLIQLDPELLLYPFLLAAIFSPSDPSSTFLALRGDRTRVNTKIETILGGEAALNDIIAILLVVIILIPAQTEEGVKNTFLFSPPILVDAIWQTLGGIFLGLIIGLLALFIIRSLANSIEESLVSLVAVLILFSIGSLLHVSIAISALIAGIVFGNPKIFKLNPNLVTTQITSFWEFFSFFFEIVSFIFIGTTLSLTIFFNEPEITIFSLIVSVIVIGGRIGAIYITTVPYLEG